MNNQLHIPLWFYVVTWWFATLTGWILGQFIKQRLHNVQPTRDCCDELIHAAMNVESNVIADGFTIQCTECLTWWRFIQGGAVWWERTDTNERRAAELREEQTMQVCGAHSGYDLGMAYVCNLPRGHVFAHQWISPTGKFAWAQESEKLDV